MDFILLNPDQRREMVNTQQRFQAYAEARLKDRACRGSMVWSETKGHSYLVRSSYDRMGRRRQSSLGRRSQETEKIKAEFEIHRAEARSRLHQIQEVLARQAAVNRALRLGRVPSMGARILRALHQHNLLGRGLRVIGTHALYAYEAVAGVHFDAAFVATEDVDLLVDTRGGVTFVASEAVETASLLRILRAVDRSFERSSERYRAVNASGYWVDLVTPMRNPPWSADLAQIGHDGEDLSGVEIEGLTWHESAPAFEAVAIDERGEPVPMVTSDPRVFAAHKHWLSRRLSREPNKRRRDAEQARLVAALVADSFGHLVFSPKELRMLPLTVVEAARPLFEPTFESPYSA